MLRFLLVITLFFLTPPPSPHHYPLSISHFFHYPWSTIHDPLSGRPLHTHNFSYMFYGLLLFFFSLFFLYPPALIRVVIFLFLFPIPLFPSSSFLAAPSPVPSSPRPRLFSPHMSIYSLSFDPLPFDPLIHPSIQSIQFSTTQFNYNSDYNSVQRIAHVPSLPLFDSFFKL